jgi:hypothetical protein
MQKGNKEAKVQCCQSVNADIITHQKYEGAACTIQPLGFNSAVSPGVKHAPLHPGARFSSSGLVQPSSYRSDAVTVCLSGILCCVVEVV